MPGDADSQTSPQLPSSAQTHPFPRARPLPRVLSAAPEVTVRNLSRRPFDTSVAAARTCYTGRGPVTAEEVSGEGAPTGAARARAAARRERLAKSIYEAGHHTTFQHAHVEFALANVSRHLVWSFLHAHPFYNSEQVSQRYVEVEPGRVVVPPLRGEALAVYEREVARQMETYRDLCRRLRGPVEAAYLAIFPGRRRAARTPRDVARRAQEAARYVLPVATHTHLVHTISTLTLLRYWRLCESGDLPLEQHLVVRRMVEALLAADPLFATILEEPLPAGETPERAILRDLAARDPGGGPGSSPIDARRAAAFIEDFDRSLEGHVSKLVDWKARNEEILAAAVREVLGLPRAQLDDGDAIRLVLDPASNRDLGETLNVTTLSKLSRALVHPAYTFRKRLSHSADSQDQRHRMTPASRPLLAGHLRDEPDYVLPEILRHDDASHLRFEESMARTWEAIGRLRRLGVSAEFVSYLLPNAVAVRFTESADLLNLHHKLKSRLCYNAQEEIWRASRDEALQIREINPRIGRHLLPPCGLRDGAGRRPICPEGDRFCGIAVWKLDPADYARTI